MSAPRAVTRLLHELQGILWKAAARDQLVTPPELIGKVVTFADPPAEVLAVDRDAWAVVGGIKDHKRTKANARLIRRDGAWIHFSVSVTANGEPLAYDFELVFDQEDEPRKAKFVRIDFNPPGHDNDVLRHRRCHLHPGHDDVQVPWSQQPPTEILDLLVNDLSFIKER